MHFCYCSAFEHLFMCLKDIYIPFAHFFIMWLVFALIICSSLLAKPFMQTSFSLPLHCQEIFLSTCKHPGNLIQIISIKSFVVESPNITHCWIVGLNPLINQLTTINWTSPCAMSYVLRCNEVVANLHTFGYWSPMLEK